MRNYLVIIVLLLAKFVSASILFEPRYLTDTITPPPYFPGEIFGVTNSCVGETDTYTSDIPLECAANWYVDGVLQSSTTGLLEVTWTNSGSFLIILDFECDTATYPSDSLLVTVADVPAEPSHIQGEMYVCSNTTKTYSTTVGEGESCQWIVDGIVQISDSTSMSYYWSELGSHLIEVQAVDSCGIGDVTYLDITVFEQPIVNLGNDTTIFEGQTLELDAGNLGSTYLWSTGETTQTIVVSQSGNYEVVVSNACGSVADVITVEVIVGVDETDKLDGFNVVISGDNIFIDAPHFYIKEVQIWDIAGRLVIKSTDKISYYLPQNGVYIIKVISDKGDYFNCRIVK